MQPIITCKGRKGKNVIVTQMKVGNKMYGKIMRVKKKNLVDMYGRETK